MTRPDISMGLCVLIVLLISSCGSVPASEEFPLLSKRIFVPDPNDTFINFHTLRTTLREYAEDAPEEMGIYFEYLPSGASVGVYDERKFAAASLLKVPIAMAVYQLHKQGKLDLEQMETLTQPMLNDRFGSMWKKGVGHRITVHDAIREMLIQSDNTAKLLLVDVLNRTDPQALDDIFDELDIPKEFDGSEAIISPLSYSSIMRNLYLSGSLAKEDSAEILDLLTKTPFVDKLQAGIPDEVLFAHKIGVFNPGGSMQVFSDCGIVYVPKRPYLLCVMIKTQDEITARTYMRDISARTYDAVRTAVVELR